MKAETTQPSRQPVALRSAMLLSEAISLAATIGAAVFPIFTASTTAQHVYIDQTIRHTSIVFPGAVVQVGVSDFYQCDDLTRTFSLVQALIVTTATLLAIHTGMFFLGMEAVHPSFNPVVAICFSPITYSALLAPVQLALSYTLRSIWKDGWCTSQPLYATPFSFLLPPWLDSDALVLDGSSDTSMKALSMTDIKSGTGYNLLTLSICASLIMQLSELLSCLASDPMSTLDEDEDEDEDEEETELLL